MLGQTFSLNYDTLGLHSIVGLLSKINASAAGGMSKQNLTHAKQLSKDRGNFAPGSKKNCKQDG